MTYMASLAHSRPLRLGRREAMRRFLGKAELDLHTCQPDFIFRPASLCASSSSART